MVMSVYVSATHVIASCLNVLYTTIQIQNMPSRWLANDNKLLLENPPNGSRACLDFQNFPGEDAPYPSTGIGLRPILKELRHGCFADFWS